VCCSVLQCVAVCHQHCSISSYLSCSKLPCFTVFYSVFQCVTIYSWLLFYFQCKNWVVLIQLTFSIASSFICIGFVWQILVTFQAMFVCSCSVLQCVAVCYCVLQCVAVCCRVLQCVAVCCSVLQCVAVCCSVLQRVAACCSVLPRVAMCCSVFWHILVTPQATDFDSLYLKRVAVCYSVLQCAAVCFDTFWLYFRP